ncbi:type II secretion system protein N [Kangiella sediminilitoris]|uniref:Type II secretion system protein N n=1 Tax=Kangiella sediminilitoris TaxID=1144748 RepID=A0A1B3B8A3_9GAMM|nr:type II secretion system protein N [Kangiella sediminilitoris]AOE49028.1 hypothetical protein KS2013_302 [Kangiella sediminilitoris]
MKKIIMGAVLALILFVAMLVILAPANTISSLLAEKVPGLTLKQVNGTLWSTKVGRINYKQYELRDLQLETSLLGLLLGKLQSSVKVNDPKLKLNSEMDLREGRYRLKHTDFTIDTAYVTSVVQLPIEGLIGPVNGNITELEMTQQELLELNGGGTWSNAVIQYPGSNLELGTIHFTLSKLADSDNTIRVEITDNQGVLDLKGYIDASLDKRFNMNLSTTTDVPQNLKSWLSRWGRTENNRIYLQWQGRIP